MPSEKSELKPCPFCGGTAKEVERNIQQSNPFHTEVSATVKCIRCGATISKKWYENNLQKNECFLNNDTVYDLWNRRVDNA